MSAIALQLDLEAAVARRERHARHQAADQVERFAAGRGILQRLVQLLHR